MSSATGLEDLPSSTGMPPGALTAHTSSATTVASPADEIAARQAIGAIGHVENLSVQLPPGAGTTTFGVREANAQASAVCVAGTPVLDGSSDANGITIGGQDVPAEQAAQQLSQQLAPLGDVVDLKFDEQLRTGSSLTVNAVHLRVLSAAGTPVLDMISGQAQVSYAGSVCDPRGQTPTGGGNGSGSGNGNGNGNGSANGADSRTTLANGVRGSTCGKLTMYFAKNHKRSLTNRLGKRQVVRGRIVNCKGHSIVRARIDVIHVLKNGKRKLVKTGLRSRDAGKLTLILPLNLKTRDLRFEYRGNLLSTKVTSRSTLHIKVRNRKGKVVR
ncbi:MAG TPA: hypothetical protein VFY32_10065 [Solirubrobacteraceae bacterium]|nr:hypothetical protein [Solirubrobacteraceae bacterium]